MASRRARRPVRCGWPFHGWRCRYGRLQ